MARTGTYIYVYVNGKPLGFTDNWMDTSGYGKAFISFGGRDFFACEAWKFASADTAEEAAALLTEWLAVKGLHVGAPMVCTGMPPEFPAAHGDWTRERVRDIVLDTLRGLGLPEEDLNGEEMRWVVSRYPLSVDFDTHEGVEGKRLHGEHYFPVLGSMTKKDIRRRVRDWAHSLRGHWKEEGPISAYGRRMAEKFPAAYRKLMGETYGKCPQD